MFGEYNVHIDFAYRTFKWGNEAKGKAAVHCVIVGFSIGRGSEKVIYDGEEKIIAKNINPYLVDAPDVLIISRGKPICNVPQIFTGNLPADGGNLIVTASERAEIISKEPQAESFIKPYVGAVELINGGDRHCIWLNDVPFDMVKRCSLVLSRIEKAREFRLASSAKPTIEKANIPHLFFFIAPTSDNYLAIPKTSSENRRYIPIGFMNQNTIASDNIRIIPNASLYHFGILTSNVHNVWVRAVCGRLKSDYRYSGTIVYNNFPWPDTTDEQKLEIEKLAQVILDARAQYPGSTLADMYGKNSMPFHPELVKAHKALDRVVMQLYGFTAQNTPSEAACVAKLMERYQKLVRGMI